MTTAAEGFAMTTVTDLELVQSAEPASPTHRSHGFRRIFTFGKQYSLRTVFISMTVCAVVVGWYGARFDIEASHQLTLTIGNYEPDDVGSPIRLLRPLPTRKVVIREVAQVRRRLGDEPIRDGVCTYFDETGMRFAQETWANGVLHGPYKQWSLDGDVEVTGQYVDGNREGEWIISHVARSSIELGCPPYHDVRRPVDETQPYRLYNPFDIYPSGKGDVQKTYVHGRCVRQVAPCFGPNQIPEIEIAEYRDDGSTQRRQRWTEKRDVKIEEEIIPGKHRSELGASIRGWYPSGEKYYEATISQYEVRSKWLYWDVRGNVIHDVKFDERGRIVLDQDRSMTGFWRIRSAGCLVGDIPDYDPIYERLSWDMHVMCRDRPLNVLVDELSKICSMQILIDQEALDSAKIPVDAPVTIQTRGLPLHAALCIALRPYNMTCVSLHKQLFVTTDQRVPQEGRTLGSDPCGPPYKWVHPAGMSRYDETEYRSRFAALQKRATKSHENATLPILADSLSKACNITINIERDLFKPGVLDSRVVKLNPKRQDAFDQLASALFQCGAYAIERNAKTIVIVPRGPLLPKPEPVTSGPSTGEYHP